MADIFQSRCRREKIADFIPVTGFWLVFRKHWYKYEKVYMVYTPKYVFQSQDSRPPD